LTEIPGLESPAILRENRGYLPIVTQNGPMNDWLAGPAGGGQQVPAGGDGVQGVQGQIYLLEIEGTGIFIEIFFQALDFQGRIDAAEELGGSPGFGLPQAGSGGQELAVEIGWGKAVAVGQQQPPHPEPGQKLSLIAPQAAQTHHQDAGGKEPFLLGCGEDREITLQAFGKNAGREGLAIGLPKSEMTLGGPSLERFCLDHEKFEALAAAGLGQSRK
jgi:hypothetical protein